MSETNQTLREKVHALTEQLPPDASWDDVIEEARFQGRRIGNCRG
jgi:hypothetical protein